MKTISNISLFTRLTATALAASVLASCSPPSGKAKYEHEGPAREWQPTVAPKDVSVESKTFETYSLKKGDEILNKAGADLLKELLLPLADLVLNAKFLDDPNYRTQRMSLLINQFTDGFKRLLDKKDKSPEFANLKKRFTDTVMAGCSRDLKYDCQNLDLFRADGRFSRIMTLLAMDLDPVIKTELEKANFSNAACIRDSAVCRDTVEDRYRFLALGMDRKSSRTKDTGYALAYLKYAMLFSTWLAQIPDSDDSFSGSYIRQSHTSIFDVLIADFRPSELNAADVREFTRNFNGWKYSIKSTGNTPGFERGVKEMMRISTECCLYTDTRKTVVDPSVVEAIVDAQNAPDDIKYGPTFLKMVNAIPESLPNYPKFREKMFQSIDPELAAKLPYMSKLEIGKANPFYNEMFFVIDRLYREDLDQPTIDMIFSRLNLERAKAQMPKMISDYLKTVMIYRIYSTNVFMNGLFNSNLGSSEILQEVLARSLNTSTNWTDFQVQSLSLSLAMERHLSKPQFRTPEYDKTKEMVDAINRNIHYMAIYPGMFLLNYFATKSNGTISIRSPFGSFDIEAEFALEKFLEGRSLNTEVGNIWLRFARELLAYSRQTLLYGWYYLLNTKTLDMFQENSQLTDINSSPEERAKSSRTRYLETIFNKYLNRTLESLNTQLRSYDNTTVKAQGFDTAYDICNYELGTAEAPPRAPNVRINLLELESRTYTGSSIMGLSKIPLAFLNDGSQGIKTLETAEVRIRYARVLLRILEDELIKTGQIKAYGDPHADTKQLRLILDGLEAGRAKLTRKFMEKRQFYFDCAIRLRQIERRRAIHLYETERQWLNDVYTRIEQSGVLKMTNEEIRDRQLELRAQLFPGSIYDTIDGTTYNLSKYDLLMRMKREIERPDFEKNEINDGLKKPRSVTIFLDEETLKTNPLKTGPTSAPLQAGLGRDKFVEQGMQLLSSRAGSFINWESQLTLTDSFNAYFRTLLMLYLQGPVMSNGEKLEITPDIIKKDFLTHLQLFGMDETDVAKAVLFKTDGTPRDRFRDSSGSYVNLFQKDGSTTRPLYYSLALNLFELGNLRVQSRSFTDDTTLFIDAVTIARGFDNQGVFVFGKPEGIEDAVRAAYGDVVRDRVNRLTEFYDSLERDQAQKTIAELAPGLTRPLFVDDKTPVYWSTDNSKFIADVSVRDSFDDFVKSFLMLCDRFYHFNGTIKFKR